MNTLNNPKRAKTILLLTLAALGVPLLIGAQSAASADTVWDLAWLDSDRDSEFWTRYQAATLEGWEPFLASSGANNDYWSSKVYLRKKVSKSALQKNFDTTWSKLKTSLVGTFKSGEGDKGDTLTIKADRTFSHTKGSYSNLPDFGYVQVTTDGRFFLTASLFSPRAFTGKIGSSDGSIEIAGEGVYSKE